MQVPSAEEAGVTAAAASSRTGTPAEGPENVASTSGSNGSHAAPAAGTKPVQASMHRKLTEALQPSSYVLHGTLLTLVLAPSSHALGYSMLLVAPYHVHALP